MTDLRRDDRDGVPRVAVVGAGIGGLAAAALLAEAGLTVDVLDGAGAAGGRARTTVGPAGHHVNLGPHALGLGGHGARVLGRLGIDAPGRSPRVTRLRWWQDGRLRSGLGAADLRAVVAVTRALDRVDPNDPTAASTSVARWIAEQGLPPLHAGAVARIATYAADLELLSLAVLAAQHRNQPVRYVDGGWATIVASLRARAERAGARVRLGHAVGRVLGDDRVTGVVVDDDVLPVDAVVLATGSPQRTRRVLPAAAAAALEDATAGMVAVRAATLDVSLATRRGDTRLALGLDRPDYLSDHGAVAALAPPGHTVVHVARYLAAGTRGDATDRVELEALLEAAAPGWRDRVVAVRWKPSLTVTHALPVADRGGVAGRPSVDVTGVAGLALVGDWVGARGHLADATLASAETAATLLLGELGRRRVARPAGASA